MGVVIAEGEMVRRKLHNFIQELKGNIRVRPLFLLFLLFLLAVRRQEGLEAGWAVRHCQAPSEVTLGRGK